MIELSPTLLLMAALLAATLLGGGIGACLWHLYLVRRHAAALAARQVASEREREAFDTVLARERETGMLKHRQERRRTLQERERAERAIGRQEVLAVREREQSRRIEMLEAEVRGLEERRTRARRDIAGSRARDRSGVLPVRLDVSRIGDDRLPVLNRRVGTSKSPAVERDEIPFGGDLEIPPLPESELPDASDELVLELLHGEQGKADDHG